MQNLRYRYGPRLAEWLVGLTVHRAKRNLRGKDIRILADTNIRGKGVTHESAWISTGSGPPWVNSLGPGYLARIPVHGRDCDTEEYRSVKYLRGLARLANDKSLSIWTSAELMEEEAYQPMGRFRGYGWYDYNVFGNARFESCDGHALTVLSSFSPSTKEQQQQRLDNATDPLFLAIADALDPKDRNDAWHIRTAERHGMYCFLTMDFKLIRKVRDRMNREPFRSLTTKVMSPEEFGKEFGLLPVKPVIFSYSGASYPVRADLHWPDSRRRPPARANSKNGA